MLHKACPRIKHGGSHLPTLCKSRPQLNFRAARPITTKDRTTPVRLKSSINVVAEELQEWDVIEYQLPHPINQATTAVGLVVEIAQEEVVLEALAQEEDGMWVHDEGQLSPVKLPLQSVLQVLAADYSQRMDADRRANPHGEHAHDVWQVLDELTPSTYRGGRYQVKAAKE